MTTKTAADLEKAAKEVKLDQMYEDFFKDPKKSSAFDKNCNVFDKGDKQNEEAKKLCSELVYYLEKIRGKSTKEEDSKKYCGYLHYWLYDKIDKIQNSPTTKIDKIKFYEDLINAGKAVKGTNLKSTCPLSNLKNVDLNELKNRKLSYIYFKNLENIKQIIASKKKEDCTKRSKRFRRCKRNKRFRRCNSTKRFSSHNQLIEFVNYCFYINCWRYTKNNNCVKSNNNHKYNSCVNNNSNTGKNNKCNHYNKYGNYYKYKKFIKPRRIYIFTFIRWRRVPNITTSIIFRGITNFIKFIKNIGPGHALQTVSSYNSNTGGDTNLASITDVPGTSETLYDKLDSNTIKNIVMAAAVLGIIFFLFYYNRSSRIESSIKPKKRKKKAFEHNYYEEYEKELAKYESDNESLDSLEDRYYLTYQPEGDSHY
ncbi:hypothetical protein PVNG_05512 [Plasmodium vivax North Korean]|uniref:VIR protein n=1 Tax=Plasmodium vivax North Korean TaxID=1035514 RepID=A0A0J9U1Q6_PLAVI|nr:hypothetical protein PVNG_05512 [Plasmodium vivax North Korean]